MLYILFCQYLRCVHNSISALLQPIILESCHSITSGVHKNDSSAVRLPGCHTRRSHEREVPVLAMSTAVEESTSELLWTSSLQRVHVVSCQVTMTTSLGDK